MMDKKIVDYVARLSRVSIKDAEKDYFGAQLSKIIGYIDKLKEVDVSKVELLRSFSKSNNVLRDDTPRLSNIQKDILNNAPLSEGGCIKIPKVI